MQIIQPAPLALCNFSPDRVRPADEVVVDCPSCMEPLANELSVEHENAIQDRRGHPIHARCFKIWCLSRIPASTNIVPCITCNRQIDVRPLFRWESVRDAVKMLWQFPSVRSTFGVVGLLVLLTQVEERTEKYLRLSDRNPVVIGFTAFGLAWAAVFHPWVSSRVQEVDGRALFMGLFISMLLKARIKSELQTDMAMPFISAAIAFARVIRR